MVYKINWDEESEMFKAFSYDHDESKDEKSNLVGQNDGLFSSHLENPQMANALALLSTTLVAEGKISVHRCRSCGLYFTISKEDEGWFTNHELGVPRKCYCCRRQNRRTKKIRNEAAE